MSVQQFTDLFANRVVESIKKQTDIQLSAKKLRQSLTTTASRQESLLTRGSLDKLRNDFSLSNIVFYTPTGKVLEPSIAQNNLNNLVPFLTKIDFDEFSEWVLDKYNTKQGFSDKFTQPESRNQYYKGNIEQFTSSNTTETYAVLGKYNPEAKGYKDTLFLKNIPHGKLVEFLADYMHDKLGADKDTVSFFKANTQSGHLTGILAIRTKNFFDVQLESTGNSLKISGNPTPIGTVSIPNQADIQGLDIVAAIVKLIADADYISSNLADHYGLFISADKEVFSNNPSVSTEAQLKDLNTKAGNVMTDIGKAISALSDKHVSDPRAFRMENQTSSAKKALEDLLKGLSKVGTFLKDTASQITLTDKASRAALSSALLNEKFIRTFINSPGSTPLVQSFGDTVAAIISTNKKPPIQKTSIKLNTKILNNNIPIVKQGISKIAKASKNIQKTLSSKKSNIIKPVNITKKSNPIRNLQGRFYSLANLQVLLNTHLQDVISANMGNGSDKSVLNYRTGRFAAAPQVERLSQSREGLITAFYSYMKNPYQTFEPGFKQGSPKTRDPRLLISKSIHEIAATMVGNKLRAVSI